MSRYLQIYDKKYRTTFCSFKPGTEMCGAKVFMKGNSNVQRLLFMQLLKIAFSRLVAEGILCDMCDFGMQINSFKCKIHVFAQLKNHAWLSKNENFIQTNTCILID